MGANVAPKVMLICVVKMDNIENLKERVEKKIENESKVFGIPVKEIKKELIEKWDDKRQKVWDGEVWKDKDDFQNSISGGERNGD